MERIFVGKTIDEILKIAAEKKQCDVSKLYYDVVEEKQSFLGLKKEIKARIYYEKDVIDFIYEYLNSYFEGISFPVDIQIEFINIKKYNIYLNSEKNGILIGKNGVVINSIKKIVEYAVSNEFKHRFDIFVDVNGYKKNRYEKLAQFAKQAAYSVEKTKVDVTLDPMPSDERKIIHKTISNMTHVSTKSEGIGRNRRVKIIYN